MAHEAGPARGRRPVRRPRGPLRGALGFVVLVAAGASAAAREPVRVDRYATCNATTAQNANVAKALAAARGGTLVVPTECVLVLLPSAVTFTKMSVRLDASIGGSAGMTVTLRKNGADLPTSAGLQCTIGSGGATTCEDADAAHAVAYAPGDTFAVKLVTGAGSGAIHPSICFETS